MKIINYPSSIYRPWWLGLVRRDMEIKPPPDPPPSTTYFYDFNNDTTGALPSVVELTRSSVSGDYLANELNGRKVLEYAPVAGGTAARGFKFTEVPEGNGNIHVRAVLRDVNTSSPPGGRIIANASDSPSNQEYGVFISGGNSEVRVYKRVNGSYADLITAPLAASFSATDHYVVELKVEFGEGSGGDCLISGRAYKEDTTPPNWLSASDGDLAQGGYVGGVGFAEGAEIRYDTISVGLDGAAAPIGGSVDVFLVAGQSNPDGRVSYNDANAPSYLGDRIVDGVKAWNGSEVIDYHLGNIGPSGNGSGWVTNASLDNYAFVHVGLYEVAAHLSTRVVACQVTEGGTAIVAESNPRGCWNADYASIPDGTPALLQELENRFLALKAYCTAKGITLNVRGAIWHQGATDGDKGVTQAEYYALSSAVFNKMRAFTGVPDLAIYTGTRSGTATNLYPAISAAKLELAEDDPNNYCRDCADLTTFDGAHFDALSCNVFGEWIAETFFAHEGIVVTEPALEFSDIITTYYANGESGLVTDTKDLTTLYQDTSGTTAVVAEDPIGRVENQLGTGVNLAQSVSGSRPTAQTSGLMLFDGASDFLDTGVTQIGNTRLFADATDQFYVAAVFRVSNNSSGSLIAKAGTDSGNRQFHIFFYGSNMRTETPIIRVRGGDYRTDWQLDDGAVHVVWANWDGSTLTVGYDDQPGEVATTVVGSAAEETSQRILIGARSNGANFTLNGALGVPLIRDVSVSESDRTSLALSLLNHVSG